MVRLPSRRTFKQAKKVYELHAAATRRAWYDVKEEQSHRTDAGNWLLGLNRLGFVARVSTDGTVTLLYAAD